MKKDELLVEINKLPLFRLRDVAVKEEFKEEERDRERWVEQDKHQAVTEVGRYEALAFVSKNYNLVNFSEMFTPIVEKIENCEGDLIYHFGFSIMDIFPAMKEFKVDKDEIGIVAYNSVNKTSALNIRFCIRHNGRKITIPKKVASFRKVHLGNIGQMTQDYISVITQIRNAWTTVITKFTGFEVTIEDLPLIIENFKIDEHAVKKMKKKMMDGMKYNLWDFCMEVFDYISNKNYKSDVHRRKRLDGFVASIFDYDLVMQI